jgi:hypothetical protein
VDEKLINMDLDMHNFKDLMLFNNTNNLNKIYKLFLELKSLKMLIGYYISYINEEMKKIMDKYIKGLKK